MDLVQHVTDGELVESCDGGRFDSVDPWTREPWGRRWRSAASRMRDGLSRPRAAFDTGPWPGMGHAERGAPLHRLADLIDEHAEDLAAADTRDMGKPITAMRTKELRR